MNRAYWGGSSIKGVCLQPGQFECWNDKSDIDVSEQHGVVYKNISRWADVLFDAPKSKDPTGGADHYHNLETDRQDYDKWKKNCDFVGKIGKHDFYKTKKEYV
jgi:hypothetical protein